MSNAHPLADLQRGEDLLETKFGDKLILKDPERFPEIGEIIALVNEHKWRKGILFAYLCIRFPKLHRSHHVWSLRAQGKNGRFASYVLNNIPDDPEWLALAESLLPGTYPIRERIFLAWLREALPHELLSPDHLFESAARARPEVQESPFKTFDARSRRMFRGNRT